MDIPTFYMERKESSCQKLLFSATLTRDPGKIAALDLRDPKYFIVQGNKGDSEPVNLVMEKFTMPATLKVSTFTFLLLRFAPAEPKVIYRNT